MLITLWPWSSNTWPCLMCLFRACWWHCDPDLPIPGHVWCVCLEHVDDIVTLIFQYLAMLRKEGSQEWVFKECQVTAPLLRELCYSSIAIVMAYNGINVGILTVFSNVDTLWFSLNQTTGCNCCSIERYLKLFVSTVIASSHEFASQFGVEMFV